MRIFSSSKSLLQYQHHGFSCFFFLRPMTALYRQSKKEEKKEGKKARRKIARFSDLTVTPRPTGSRRKMAEGSFALRLPSDTAWAAVLEGYFIYCGIGDQNQDLSMQGKHSTTQPLEGVLWILGLWP
jgi:hypothetical protein